MTCHLVMFEIVQQNLTRFQNKIKVIKTFMNQSNTDKKKRIKEIKRVINRDELNIIQQ